MKRIIGLIVVLLAFSVVSYSQINLKLGNAVSYVAPMGDLGKVYGSGLGISFIGEVEVINMVAVTGRAGWNSLYLSDDVKAAFGNASTDYLNIEVGGKISFIPLIYAELRAGQTFGDIEKTTLTPAIGFQFWKLDVNAGYQVLDNFQYLDLRAGIFWLL